MAEQSVKEIKMELDVESISDSTERESVQSLPDTPNSYGVRLCFGTDSDGGSDVISIATSGQYTPNTVLSECDVEVLSSMDESEMESEVEVEGLGYIDLTSDLAEHEWCGQEERERESAAKRRRQKKAGGEEEEEEEEEEWEGRNEEGKKGEREEEGVDSSSSLYLSTLSKNGKRGETEERRERRREEKAADSEKENGKEEREKTEGRQYDVQIGYGQCFGQDKCGQDEAEGDECEEKEREREREREGGEKDESKRSTTENEKRCVSDLSLYSSSSPSSLSSFPPHLSGVRWIEREEKEEEKEGERVEEGEEEGRSKKEEREGRGENGGEMKMENRRDTDMKERVARISEEGAERGEGEKKGGGGGGDIAKIGERKKERSEKEEERGEKGRHDEGGAAGCVSPSLIRSGQATRYDKDERDALLRPPTTCQYVRRSLPPPPPSSSSHLTHTLLHSRVRGEGSEGERGGRGGEIGKGVHPTSSLHNYGRGGRGGGGEGREGREEREEGEGSKTVAARLLFVDVKKRKRSLRIFARVKKGEKEKEKQAQLSVKHDFLIEDMVTKHTFVVSSKSVKGIHEIGRKFNSPSFRITLLPTRPADMPT
eukprot:CAMPEP_0113893406 /NCGR_PEP_ID=MMETSP0780_2-20120614/16064_1 /TAXON_ID=652834 /ORGANISM="Palpitomonas bilix" /LENGTH=599 /DNA_ID=CAMNT_0000883671 /DNA_START=8 /DNA_END=1807 /DNA_ORIENTATION=- /assembly_acc=CAM_ASM_000599